MWTLRVPYDFRYGNWMILGTGYGLMSIYCKGSVNAVSEVDSEGLPLAISLPNYLSEKIYKFK